MPETQKTNGTIILRFIEQLLDAESYRQLKRLAAGFSSEHKIFILSVKPTDEDTLQKMVTAAALFVDETVLSAVGESPLLLPMLQKLSRASRFILSGYKTVTQVGDMRKEDDCRFSIVTPSAHIHFPDNTNDKRFERCVRETLTHAKELMLSDTRDMLIYYDKNQSLCTESKDDYVRRMYGNLTQDV